MNTTGIGGLQ